MQGVRQLELALFMQHHQGRGGHRFGHGVDAKQCIFIQRFAIFYILRTNTGKVNYLPFSGHQNLRSGDFAIIHLLLKKKFYAIKSLQ